MIMPEGVKIRLLEMRGMPLALLIDLVIVMAEFLDLHIHAVKSI